MQFTPASGRTFSLCKRCNAGAHRCALCNVPTQRGPAAGLPALCTDCRPSARTCRVCRALVTGRYSEYTMPDGARHAVCESCQASSPQCDACRLPHRAGELRILPGNVRWCAPCIQGAKTCSLCLFPIVGTGYSLEFTEGLWCERCFETAPRCAVCVEPMVGAARTLRDGRELCADCDATAVTDARAVLAVARALEPSFARLLGRPLAMPTVRMVGAEELERVSPRRSASASRSWPPQPRTILRELGLFTVVGSKREVLILEGLPEDLLWETVAHELAHAWQHQHYPQAGDLLIVEGFAQWVAEHLCHLHGRRSGLVKLQRRNDFYGQAFRVINDIEIRGGGVPGVLAVLESNELPPGIWGRQPADIPQQRR
jgi:hypothetical protein